MGPKKKKKKGDARGFATTSVARNPNPVPKDDPKPPPKPKQQPKKKKQSQKQDAAAGDQLPQPSSSILSEEEFQRVTKVLQQTRSGSSSLRPTGQQEGMNNATLSVPHDVLQQAVDQLAEFNPVDDSGAWFRTCDLEQCFVDMLASFVRLRRDGFQEDDIATAITCAGTDYEELVDWLCLHLHDEKLPEGWYRENAVTELSINQAKKAGDAVANEAKDGPPQVDDIAGASGDAGQSTKDPGQSPNDAGDQPDQTDDDAAAAQLPGPLPPTIVDAPKPVLSEPSPAGGAKKDSGNAGGSRQGNVSIKDWILNYHENEDDDEDLDGVDGQGRSTSAPETLDNFERRMDTIPNSQVDDTFVQLSVAMELLKRAAKTMKLKSLDEFDVQGRTVQAKEVGLEIKAVRDRIALLENLIGESSVADLAPRIQSELPPVEEDTQDDSAAAPGEEEDGDGDTMFGMFDEDEAGEDGNNTFTRVECVSCVTPKNFTGPSPRQLLKEVVAKRADMDQRAPPKYKKAKAVPGYNRCTLTLARRNDKVMEFNLKPNECCVTYPEAQELVALCALWHFGADQRYHVRLAPVFRDVWKSWVAQVEAAERLKEVRNVEHAHKFVSDLMDKLSRRAMEKLTLSDAQASGSRNPETSDGDGGHGAGARRATQGRGSAGARRGEKLLEELRKRQGAARSSYCKLADFKANLPVTQIKSDVVGFLNDENVVDTSISSDVLIVCGQTGSGKTTQIPQYILEHEVVHGLGDACRIMCTEPRRISAVSVAQRVGEEMGDPTSGCGSPGAMVGYQIKGDKKASATTPLVYCTTGVLLRKLQSDPDLSGLTHLVVDEVHERTVQSDFLLVVIKRILARQRQQLARGELRPEGRLRVVLMSATVDAEKLSGYFGGAKVVEAGGRTFPVKVFDVVDALELTGYRLQVGERFAKRVDVSGGSHESVRINLNRSQAGRGMVIHGDVIANAAKQAANSVKSNDQGNVKLVANPDNLKRDDVTQDTERRHSEEALRTLDCMDEYQVNYDLVEKLLEVIEVTDPVRRKATTVKVAEHFSSNRVGKLVADDFEGALKQLHDGADEDNGNSNNNSDASAVLVFLSGLDQIQKLQDQLLGHPVFGDESRYLVLALHSALATSTAGAEQRKIFNTPPKGVRKIVLATNIAETGVTIPDVVYVIDSCKVKELRYDSGKRINKLEERFVSRANALQRQGRAGRVRPGICFRLVSQQKFDSLAPYTKPEIQRAALEDLCLQIVVIHAKSSADTGNYYPPDFLAEALDPPATQSVDLALGHLVSIGAIERVALGKQGSAAIRSAGGGFQVVYDKTKTVAIRLKPLGAHLGTLPLDVQVGKMLIYSCLMNCVDPVLTIAASIDQKTPFLDDEAARKFAFGYSDLLTIHNVYDTMATYIDKQSAIKTSLNPSLRRSSTENKLLVEFCKQNRLSVNVMKAISRARRDLATQLAGIGFLSREYTAKASVRAAPCNANAKSLSVVCSVVAAGLYPNLAYLQVESTKKGSPPPPITTCSANNLVYKCKGNKQVHLHRKSINFGMGVGKAAISNKDGSEFWDPANKGRKAVWLVFLEKMQTSRVFLYDSTFVSPSGLALFAGGAGDLKVIPDARALLIDGWVEIQTPPKTAVVFKAIRRAFDSLLMRKISDPSVDISGDGVVKAVTELMG